MRKLDVQLELTEGARRVGTLAEHERRIYFEFDPGFIANPLPLSPFKLPARPGLFEHRDRDFAPVFGVFNDSLPDGWGLLLMDREFRKRGIDPATLSVLDRLAYIGDRGMGAPTYHPASDSPVDEPLRIDLEAVAGQAARVLNGSAEEVLPALRIAGGSPGGARPKVLIGVRDENDVISGTSRLPEGYRHYLVKFPAQDDPADIGAVELAYAAMARSAGLDVPNSRLFETADGGRFFGAERFDRDGNRRIHTQTLGGLLHASHRLPSVDYEGLLKATRYLTKDQRQVEEAFRRMTFNVFAHNRDDHVKNFSYLMDSRGVWRFAPAYDLVFSAGPGGEHTMSVAGEARQPTIRDMLRVAAACDVGADRARDIIDRVLGAVRSWEEFASAAQVSNETERRIAVALGKLRERLAERLPHSHR